MHTVVCAILTNRVRALKTLWNGSGEEPIFLQGCGVFEK